MTQTEALKLARTALGVQLDALLGKAGHLHNDDRRRYAENGIKAIDEALAQPELIQQPASIDEMHAIGNGIMYGAQPEQEPVAWIEGNEPTLTWFKTEPEATPLYTTPPHSFFEDVADELRVEIAELQDHIRLLEKQLAQPEQEPVGKVVDCNELGYPIVHFGQALFIGTLLYTTPPQRKPLTDEQMNKLWFDTNKQHGSVIWRFARSIEFAHGIKE